MDNERKLDIAGITVGSLIAFAALVIAIGQFLSQIFGSVEGYRRCQPSVLGTFWTENKRTTKRWRWAQFRYEVLFTTPEILLVQPTQLPLMSIERSFDPVESDRDCEKNAPINELVCWIPFLHSVHEHHENLQEGAPAFNSVPVLIERRRSWDFMPPDVIRPFASTKLSHIAILARRMGMVWTAFKPAEGVLEAQSNDHVLSSTVVRGLGLMLSYRRLSGSRHAMETKHSVPRTFVCSTQTDMMWFGILPGNPELKLRDLAIGTNEDIQNTLKQLDSTGRAGEVLEGLQREDPHRLHGFCDIVPMVALWLRQSPSTINPYPRPCPYTHGLTWYCVAYRVFYNRLQLHNKSSHATGPEDRPSTLWVQKTYKALHDEFKEEWDGISRDLNRREVAFFDTLERHYKETTQCFLDKAPTPSTCRGENMGDGKISYMHLVTTHLREAPRSYRDAQKRVDSNTLHWTDFMYDRPWRGEAMVLYWEYMPDYVRHMRAMGYTGDDATVEEAWIILMFRAFLWQRTHVRLENEPALPSRFYGSGLPVYIG